MLTCDDAKILLKLAVKQKLASEERVMSFYGRLQDPTNKQAVDIVAAISAASDEKWAEWAVKTGVFHGE